MYSVLISLEKKDRIPSPEIPEKFCSIQNHLYNGLILFLPQTYSQLLFTNRIC